MDKQATIEELRKLWHLRRKHHQLTAYVQNDCDSALSEKLHRILTSTPNCKQPAAPGLLQHELRKLPVKPNHIIRHLLCALTMAVSAVLIFYFGRTLYLALCGQLENPKSIGNALLILAGGPAIGGFLYALYSLLHSLLDKTEIKAYEQQKEQYQQSILALEEAKGRYATVSKAGVMQHRQDLEAFEASYRQMAKNACDALDASKKDKAEARQQLAQCEAELDKIDILPNQYWHLAGEMIDLLKTDRADSYKEALNMAVEQEEQRRHQDRMEEIARERARAEARRAEEERRHNREIERQAEEGRIRAAVDAKMQADRERDIQRKADEERKRAGYQRCRNCIYHNRCPNDMIARGDGLNCGRYTPS